MNGRTKVLSNAGMTDTFYIQTNAGGRPEGIITANKPIAVCQFLLSERCDGSSSNTDPAMIWVPPLEQTLKSLNFSCERANTINKFFINVVVKTRYRSSLRIDGLAPTAQWKLIQFDTSYSYIQQANLTEGNHNMTHPYGFYAMLYAYGDYGSYGFNAGSSIKPLSFFSEVNGKSSADFEADSAFFSVCQGSSIPFNGGCSATTGVTWKWHIKPPVGTLITKNSKSFTQVFNDTGIHQLTMIAIRTANGTCNGSSTVEDTVKTLIKVYNKPFIKLMKDWNVLTKIQVGLQAALQALQGPKGWAILAGAAVAAGDARAVPDAAADARARWRGRRGPSRPVRCAARGRRTAPGGAAGRRRRPRGHQAARQD
jgi:hypothetical protein